MTDDLAIAIDASPRARTWFGPLALSVATGAALVSLICTVWIRDLRFHDGCHHHGDRVAAAKLAVTTYAHQAYPAWSADHPRPCPYSLAELDRYLVSSQHLDGTQQRGTSHRDPWGRDYMFTCGGGKLYVVSLGMDGRSNTADDIWSHQ